MTDKVDPTILAACALVHSGASVVFGLAGGLLPLTDVGRAVAVAIDWAWLAWPVLLFVFRPLKRASWALFIVAGILFVWTFPSTLFLTAILMGART